MPYLLWNPLCPVVMESQCLPFSVVAPRSFLRAIPLLLTANLLFLLYMIFN
jgi:hypothetical protein